MSGMKKVTDVLAWIARFLTRRHGHDQPPTPPPLSARLRVVSDGTPQGTSITLDGVPLDRHTRSLMWSVHANEPTSKVTLEVNEVELDIAATVGAGLAARRLVAAQAAELVERRKDHHIHAVRRFGFCSQRAVRSREALQDAEDTYRLARAALARVNGSSS